MGWFKRNLFFAIGGLVAIGLLGAAGFYDYKSYQRNNEALANWTQLNGQLKENTVKWRDGKQNFARQQHGQQHWHGRGEEERQLRQWINQATNYFQPIAPIPTHVNSLVTTRVFADALHQTIDQLQHEAAAANVALPPDFYFSFTAQATGSLSPAAAWSRCRRSWAR